MAFKQSPVLRVLAVAMVLGAVVPAVAAENPQQLRIGHAAIAEVRSEKVMPLWSEASLIRFLESALTASDDPRLRGKLDSARIEREGGRYFLVGRGRNALGSCLTPSILLE